VSETFESTAILEELFHRLQDAHAQSATEIPPVDMGIGRRAGES